MECDCVRVLDYRVQKWLTLKFPRISFYQGVDLRNNTKTHARTARPPPASKYNHTHLHTHKSMNAWEVCWGSVMVAQTPIATSPLIWPFRETTLCQEKRLVYVSSSSGSFIHTVQLSLPFPCFVCCSQQENLCLKDKVQYFTTGTM